ncbi:hypothetical protein LguiB_009997 [Lonicera macranthoides]
MLFFCLLIKIVRLVNMLDQYHKHSGKRLWDAKHENLSNEIDRIKKENDSMQIELRHLNGEDITSLQYKELMAIEEVLENGLHGIRHRQDEIMNIKRKNDQMLEEENKRLTYIFQQHQMAAAAAAMDGNGRDQMDNEYNHQRFRDYQQSHMPFAFRVQPIQPNLHERI